MDCLGSAQIAGVCGISERVQYFYFRRVSRRCVDKSQLTAGPPIAMPPSCLADGHWWFQFLPYVASTLHRVLRTDLRAAALAVVFGADRFGANIITTRLALLWFPNPNSTVSCLVLRFFWTVPASFFLFAPPPLTFIYVSWNQIYPLTHLLSPGHLLSLSWSSSWQHSTLCYCTDPPMWAHYIPPCMLSVCYYQIGFYNLRITVLISQKEWYVYLEVVIPNRLPLLTGILFVSFCPVQRSSGHWWTLVLCCTSF